MTGSRLPDRPDSLDDLTRWNRAGLTRFDYVDGDAASWLEELRLALLGLYLRGGDAAMRTPEHWRDIYLTDDPLAIPAASEINGAAARVAWARLATKLQTRPETRGRRTERLLAQYGEDTGDLGWETMRAFARATHVLLGHLDAYANEGYLRTATQWDNLRRLAAMVNYQPTPPASATSTVSLTVKEGSGAVVVGRGVAMKYAPPEGGPPLIFETLDTVACHQALNVARHVDWDVNGTPLPVNAEGLRWIVPKKAELAPGDLAVLAAGPAGVAVAMSEIDRDEEAGTAEITFATTPGWTGKKHGSRLMTEPDDVRRGLPRTTLGTGGGSGKWFIEVQDLAGIEAGGVVLIGGAAYKVAEVVGQGIRILTDDDLGDDVEITPLAPFVMEGGEALVPRDVGKMYFPTSTGVESITSPFISLPGAFTRMAVMADPETRVTPIYTDVDGDDVIIALRYNPDTGTATRGYADTGDAAARPGKVIGDAPVVIPGKPSTPAQSIRFDGKPPKGLEAGAWFVARHARTDELTALQVTGVRTGAGVYTILFAQSVSDPPEEVEFHGPMTRALAVERWNRSPVAVPVGVATLQPVPPAARALLKPGRAILLTREDDRGAVLGAIQGTVTEVTDVGPNRVRVEYSAPESPTGWTLGETAVHLNTTRVGHGETKGPKTLGSGDGEQVGQSFLFQVGEISHVPSTIAEAGVVPDIDVAVNGEVWPYRDFIDPTAEGAKAWSTTLTEDGFLRIHFRRRLPTGTNNVGVQRHRVGVGARGSGVPAFSFAKPMKKHRHVEAVVQPFATAGGSDREPVAALRVSTPSRLAANGRAVSLLDFERLAKRHASVWNALAEEVAEPGAASHVRLTIVPAGGGDLTETLKADIRPVVLSRAIPGVRLSFERFESLILEVGAKVRVDLSAFDRTEVKAAAEAALAAAFALETRGFGQPVYRSEILAALETVTGVENAVVTAFSYVGSAPAASIEGGGASLAGIASGSGPAPRSIALRDGALAAIFPQPTQVAHVAAGAAAAVAVTVEDAQA
jgi:hypothetical protein